MSNLLFVGGRKGGATKTTTSHLFCLGAILKKQPAVYVLTDPEKNLKETGRPYGVMDGRVASELKIILARAACMKNGWVVVDGGGNRPDFDLAVASEADLTIIPFRPSSEDIEMVAKDLGALPRAIALPSAWSKNEKAQKSSRWLIDGLEKAFPGRVIHDPIWFVNAAADLLGTSLESPSTPVRNAARRTFDVVQAAFEVHNLARVTKIGEEVAAD
jgi:chromosome partitioning protein